MAFIQKVLIGLLYKILKDVYYVMKDQFDAWNGRRIQKKKDEASKKPYDEAVKNGTGKEIEDATEGRLNG